MRGLLLVATLLGGILSIVGVLWAVLAAHRALERMRWERAEVRAALLLPNEGYKEVLTAKGITWTSYTDLTTVRQDVAVAVLTAAKFGWPVVLALTGVALSTLASALSLFVTA